jgi:hypothetical protein
MSIFGVARIRFMICCCTGWILTARKALKTPTTPKAAARQRNKRLIVIVGSKINVDEL